MWSSKEVLLISIATGFVFCFATMYVQNTITKYVNRQVQERNSGNPLLAMGLASPAPQQHQDRTPEQKESARSALVAKLHCAPPGAGARWTPLPTS